MNMELKLEASYDQQKFEEVESFFLNRDGGGVEPMVIQDVIEERHMDEHKFGGIPGYNNQRTYFKSAKQEQNTDVFSATRKSVDPFPRHRKAFDSEAKERQEANLQPRIITDGDGLTLENVNQGTLILWSSWTPVKTLKTYSVKLSNPCYQCNQCNRCYQ
ncbi:uncharacterized protein [Ptychodera flava]|uniref:uncharacterized protein n=1 Tax=Ptychodera flava TaxID=63121 RepID=UPI00396A52CE